MAQASSLPPVPPFTEASDPATAHTAWKRWVTRFDQYLAATDIQEEKRKRALLIYLAGETVADIFATLPDTGDDYRTAIAKLNEHFEPQQNLLHETYLFRQAKQEANETLAQFHVRLQTLASRWDFGDRKDFEILLQIVINGSSSRLRKKALRDPKCKLHDILLEGQRDEASTQQAIIIESSSSHGQDLNQLAHSRKSYQPSRQKNGKCYNCGGSYPHKNSDCPAKGKTCNKCGKANHFAKICYSRSHSVRKPTKYSKKHVNPVSKQPGSEVQSTSDSDCDYLYAFDNKDQSRTLITAKVNDFQCKLLVDTGASVNVLDEATYNSLPFTTKLGKTSVKIYPCNSHSPVELLGKFQATVETKNRITVATFYVTKGTSGSILGCDTSHELGLVTLHINPVALKDNPAVFNTNENMGDQYVKYITINAIPKAMTIEEVQKETEKDETLQAVKQAIHTGDWTDKSLLPYKLASNELSVNLANGIVLRGSRIVMPKVLWKKSVKIAHEGHQGLAKTKALIREKVWFPLVDKYVTEEIANCLACQAVGPQNVPEPLRMRPMPSGPWKRLHIDFFGPVPSNEYLLVIVDAYSRFPIVEVVRSTSIETVIPKLDSVFAMHGIPNEVITDNGPPFNSHDFNRYMSLLGIKFNPSTPLWPQGNSEVERFNQPLGKAIRAACVENKNWKQEIQRFLLNYRSTPHTTTKISPAELLYNRAIKGKLPCIIKKPTSKKHREAQRNDTLGKEKMKEYGDKRRHTKSSDICVGDSVLLKQEKKAKFSASFESIPYTVISRNRSRVTAKRKDGRTITRNISFFKKHKTTEDDGDDDDDDLFHDINRENKEALVQTSREPRYPVRQRRMPHRYGDVMATD